VVRILRGGGVRRVCVWASTVAPDPIARSGDRPGQRLSGPHEVLGRRCMSGGQPGRVAGGPRFGDPRRAYRTHWVLVSRTFAGRLSRWPRDGGFGRSHGGAQARRPCLAADPRLVRPDPEVPAWDGPLSTCVERDGVGERRGAVAVEDDRAVSDCSGAGSPQSRIRAGGAQHCA
jgi:hypothetical protein